MNTIQKQDNRQNENPNLDNKAEDEQDSNAIELQYYWQANTGKDHHEGVYKLDLAELRLNGQMNILFLGYAKGIQV